MAQLAQAYLHLKPYRASDRKLKSLGHYAERIALRAAASIYGKGVEVEIELEEGSAKLRITVIGLLLLDVYGHVADYKGFKESVVEMCQDAREFAVDVCNPFIKKAGVAREDVYRFERRLKTPGKLLRINRRLEKLQRSVDDLSPRAIQKELAEVKSELDAVVKDLSPSEQAALEAKLTPEKLPPPKRWPVPESLAVISRSSDKEQMQLFDTVPATDGDPKHRLVFKSRRQVLTGATRTGKRPLAKGFLPSVVLGDEH